MRARDRLNQLLAPLSRFNLKLDQNNSCQIQCANGLVCVIELLPNTDRAFAYVPVSRLPGGDAARAALLQKALTLNLNLQKEGILSLVYDKRIDNVVLCTQTNVLEITPVQFDHWLGSLIRVSDYAQVQLMQTGLQASLESEEKHRQSAQPTPANVGYGQRGTAAQAPAPDTQQEPSPSPMQQYRI